MTEPDPVRAASGQVTRYLCVAARTDENFAGRVLGGLLAGDLRATAPSVGFDLRPVLLHCLAARRQRFLRDLAFVVCVVIALVVSPLWTILSLLVIATLAGTVRRGAARRTWPVVPVVLMVAIPVLLAVLISGLTPSGVEPRAVPLPGWLAGVPWLGLPVLLLMYAALAWDVLTTRQIVIGDLARSRFRPEAAPRPREEWVAPVLAAIEATQYGNVTPYGGFSPFHGYGTTVAGWAFAVPTWRRGRTDRGEVVEIDVLELIEHVRTRLHAIGQPAEGGGEALEGLHIADRIFVSGEALGSRFLPRRDLPPRQNLMPEEVREIAGRPSGSARHFLCAEVRSWGEEVVTSTFLHFSTDGRLLYLQCDRAVLGPVWSRYHAVDRLTDTPVPRQIGRILLSSAARLPALVAGAPGRLLRADLSGSRHRRRLQRNRLLATEDLGYDYGAWFSVRQLAEDARSHNYFQNTDVSKHLKIVERHVLTAVLDFLDEHEVDTTEFANRQMVILNQGIVQTGGVSHVGNQAVGFGATATQTTTIPPQGSQESANAG